MYISANFLERKMPEFQQRYIQGTDLLETFLYANEKLREDNLNTVQSICRESQKEQLWKGTFSRMQNAANMATFGDMRTYYYNGKKISESTHMGIDLASTKNAPVEASNDGVVVFTDYLGIYGNTVIIDHGMGLFSLYAHLSTIDVKKGQEVGKGEIIGHTGTSGMAGGDHLHFSMIVGGKFVNPQEWWDPHWIQDNVETKLNGE
jgi:murein DD-endopeptidase MepM/ murein hydrolase activator NlpD